MSTYEFTVQTSFGVVNLPPVDAETAREVAAQNIEHGLSFACTVKKGR